MKMLILFFAFGEKYTLLFSLFSPSAKNIPELGSTMELVDGLEPPTC